MSWALVCEVWTGRLNRAALIQRSQSPEQDEKRQTRLDDVANRIQDKFGQAALQRGRGMLHNVDYRSGPPGADRNQYGK